MQVWEAGEEAQWKNTWLYCDMGNKERGGGGVWSENNSHYKQH